MYLEDEKNFLKLLNLDFVLGQQQVYQIFKNVQDNLKILLMFKSRKLL